MSIVEIYQSMKAAVESGGGVHINDGGDMALRLYAAATEIYSLRCQTDWLKRQGFPQSATGEFLDLHAQVRGLVRRRGTRASGEICFQLEEVRSSDTPISAGTVCMNSGGLEFITSEMVVIAAGELFCLAPAMAREAGSFGNVPAESICQMAIAPIGVSRCFNPEVFVGGSDLERDESLRNRVLKSFARLPNGSNAAYYEAEALNTDGVAAVKVLPRARGVGTVDLVVASALGAPPAELILALQEKFEREREICVDVHILAPTPVSVNVDVGLVIENGFDAADVIERVKTAVMDIFDGRLLGKDFTRAKLGSVVFGVSGVENYQIFSPTTDVAVSASQIPVSGVVSVFEV